MHLPKMGFVALMACLVVILTGNWGLAIASLRFSGQALEAQHSQNYQGLAQHPDIQQGTADEQIQVLELTRQQRNRIARERQNNGVALVVGNPTMPSVPPSPGEKPQPLSPLPGAEREANAIAPLLDTQPLIGDRATETAIQQQLEKARIIHLATHGLLDEERGLNSALALAPASGRSALTPLTQDDGLLTAEEILNLKLNAELVVLSACDTGRGRITGDGVVGLSRAFITAGVPSAIVSLWQVPDAPTAFLMTQFY